MRTNTFIKFTNINET